MDNRVYLRYELMELYWTFHILFFIIVSRWYIPNHHHIHQRYERRRTPLYEHHIFMKLPRESTYTEMINGSLSLSHRTTSKKWIFVQHYVPNSDFILLMCRHASQRHHAHIPDATQQLSIKAIRERQLSSGYSIYGIAWFLKGIEN